MEIYDICIVGYGVATLSTLLQLSKREREQSLRVIIYDPYFDGGNLRRRYGNVRSNTTWAQFLNSIKDYCEENLHQNLRRLRGPEEVTSLDLLISSLLKVVQSNCKNLQIVRRCEEVKTCKEDSGKWIVNSNTGSAVAHILLLNYGSIPKSLNYPKPTLQLDSVINGNQLPCNRGEKIVVFGTLHSGVLCLNRLLYDSVRIVAIYKGDSPFTYVRDGAYDGLKQEAAQIADNLIHSSIHFISSEDHESINKELDTCDWVLYACGFKPSDETLKVFTTQDQTINIRDYNSKTGQIGNRPNLFGFGIAYPNSNLNEVDGKTYYDVSFPAFMKHIGSNIDTILAYLEK